VVSGPNNNECSVVVMIEEESKRSRRLDGTGFAVLRVVIQGRRCLVCGHPGGDSRWDCLVRECDKNSFLEEVR